MQTPIEVSHNQGPNSEPLTPRSPSAPDKPPSPEEAAPDQRIIINQLPPSKPLPLKLVIGTLDLRTPAEEIEFQECEMIVRQGWAHFAQVGDALARIRDKRLYKNEYNNFEDYCRERWGFGHSQTGRYISAAQLHKTFAATPGMPMPACEAQVRPLIGLPVDLAQQAWLHALSWSQDGHVPARLVKRAVKQVLKTDPPGAPKPKLNPQQRYETRRALKQGFQELLSLLLARTAHEVLIGKVQALQRLMDSLLTPKKRK